MSITISEKKIKADILSVLDDLEATDKEKQTFTSEKIKSIQYTIEKAADSELYALVDEALQEQRG